MKQCDIGSTATVYDLKRLHKGLKVTIVSVRLYFGFTPAWPHLALLWVALRPP